MDKAYTCCVTGHRDIPEEKIPYVHSQLLQELLHVMEGGYTHFISGFASGVDLIFAEIVSNLKRKYPITLEAAIPYSGRMNTPDQTFHRLLKECDIVRIHTDKYCKCCYMVRNRYMVDHSTLVIAVHDGRKSGGTAATIRYAYQMRRIVREIKL